MKKHFHVVSDRRMNWKKRWKNFVKVMFTGTWCCECNTYDSILVKEVYPEFHYRCPNCGYEWIVIDSLLNQWINKRKISTLFALIFLSAVLIIGSTHNLGIW